MARRILTEGERSRINQLLREGVRVHLIAQELDLSDVCIYGFKHRMIEEAKESDPDYIVLRATVIELRKQNKNSAQISVAVKCRLKTVNSILERCNIINETESDIRSVSL